MAKTTLVADPVYGSVSISQIEKRVLATELFNRLHHVRQTSMVYYTYPSSTMTRLSHSLGCMHVAGQMFLYGVSNSQQRDRFIEDFVYHLTKLRSDLFQTYSWSEHTSMSLQQAIIDGDDPSCLAEDRFYSNGLTVFSSEPKKTFAYLIAFQSVRLAALLHDLGHPPFSHVSEFALTNLAVFSQQGLAAGSHSTREERFMQIFSPYFGRELHESIGLTLARILLTRIITDVRNDAASDQDNRLRQFLFNGALSCHIALRILEATELQTERSNEEAIVSQDHISESDLLMSLQGIHNADAAKEELALDADRLDYVARDKRILAFGNLNTIDRLLYTYDLVYVKHGMHMRPLFLPSIRAIIDIQDFFAARFQLWKGGYYHHTVVRSDGLLQALIEELAQEYLKESTNASETEDPPYVLPSNISGLWTALDLSNTQSEMEIVYRCMQWDDSWLLSVLRRTLVSLRVGELDFGETKNEILIARLEQVLFRKKSYYSLFKRDEDFIVTDNALLRRMAQNPTWVVSINRLIHATTPTGIPGRSKLTELLNEVRSHLYSDSMGHQPATNDDQVKAFVYHLQDLLITLGVVSPAVAEAPDKRVALMNAIAHGASQRLCDLFGLKDVVVRSKRIKVGIRPGCLLAASSEGGGGVVSLDRLSVIRRTLEFDAQRSLPFYAFVYPESRAQVTSGSMNQLRTKLGECLALEFMNWIDTYCQ